MADVITNFSSLQTDAPNVWITRQMFLLAERKLAIGQFARREVLANYMSKTLRINRYRRFNLPTAPLIEGVPPASQGLVVDNVDVTVEQWGIVCQLTDVAMLTVNHPILQIAMDRTALAISETTERETGRVLITSPNVVYPGTGNLTRADLAATDKLDTATILACTVQLRGRGAADFEGGLYGGVMQPQQEGDVLATDQTFQQASNFARVRKLEYAEIGIWMGVQWVRGNFLPFFQGVVAPSATAATTEKAQATGAATGGVLAAGDYIVAVVARELVSDYERKISQNSAVITTTGSTSSITVSTPTSVNYTYDIYMSQVSGTVLYRVRSRIPANTPTTITTQPTGAEPTKPVAPAATVTTYPGWVFGQDAFMRVELNQMSMQSYITPAGASWDNPLAQGRKVGTKYMFKVSLLDPNFLMMFETGSAFPSLLPA